METGRRGYRKHFVGTVTSIAGHKSVVVSVTRRVQHPLYKKYINRTRKFMAHDESCACSVGDIVEIEETRPLSARKRWRVIRTLQKAATVGDVVREGGGS